MPIEASKSQKAKAMLSTGTKEPERSPQLKSFSEGLGWKLTLRVALGSSHKGQHNGEASFMDFRGIANGPSSHRSCQEGASFGDHQDKDSAPEGGEDLACHGRVSGSNGCTPTHRLGAIHLTIYTHANQLWPWHPAQFKLIYRAWKWIQM